jgi:hypothetical protein
MYHAIWAAFLTLLPGRPAGLTLVPTKANMTAAVSKGSASGEAEQTAAIREQAAEPALSPGEHQFAMANVSKSAQGFTIVGMAVQGVDG